MEQFPIIVNGFQPFTIVAKYPILIVVAFLNPCSIAKEVSWFKPKKIVIYACLWGKYFSKLEKRMSLSLISLNLQYCNHNLLGYNRSQIKHSLPSEANSGVTFLGQSFSLYLKKLQNIIVLLYPSVFHRRTSSERWFYKNYICRQTIVTRARQ